MSRSFPFDALPLVPLHLSPLAPSSQISPHAGPSRTPTLRPEVLLLRGRDRLLVPASSRSTSLQKPHQKHPSGQSSPGVMPTQPELQTLQRVRCKWLKCDAELASAALALKHYQRHLEQSDQGGLCGVARCPHRFHSPESREVHTHYLSHHINVLECEPGEVRRSVQPAPPVIRPGPLAHLPDLVPAYLVSCPPVQVRPPRPPLPLLPDTTRPTRHRHRSRSKSRDTSKRQLDLQMIVADFGDAAFWPMRGEAIAETTRHSSYIFPHPAAYSNDPVERALIDRMKRGQTPDTGPSSTSDFPFACSSSYEDRMDIDLVEDAKVVNSDISAVSDAPAARAALVHNRVSFAIVPIVLAGSRPLTVPLADIFSREAKRKRSVADDKGKGRAIGERVIELRADRRRKAEGTSRIRRIAERVAARSVKRSIGVDWWEAMFEIEGALEAAAAEGSEGPPTPASLSAVK